MGFKKVCVLVVGFTVLFVNYRIEKFNRTFLKELEGFKDEVVNLQQLKIVWLYLYMNIVLRR